MDTFIVKIENKTLKFNTDYHRALFMDFLKEHEGRELRIQLAKNPVSDNMRGYYFAAVIPTVQSVITEWSNLPSKDVHEMLKKLFNYFDCFNPITKRTERYGRSAMGEDSNTVRVTEFIEKIRLWLSEDYKIDLPSPEEYIKIRDQAGDDGKPLENYPELKDMPKF